jgi:hypothetical protein
MRNCLILLSIVLIIASLSGCSDDDCTPCSPPSNTETQLAVLTFGTRGGSQQIFDYMILSVYYAGGQITLPEVALTGGGEGYTVVFDTSTAGVTSFFDSLTNGTDEVLVQKFYGPSGTGTYGRYESEWIEGGSTGEFYPDLIGAEISRAVVHLDNVVIVSPGSDPNGDGIWTDYNITVRLEFLGYLND